jgi:hypothetical protein
MTYLEVINKILIRLREPEAITPMDSEYAQLIGQFVNDIKREVENSWEWLGLRQTLTITTEASTTDYSLVGAGDRYTIKDAFNSTREHRMRKVPYIWIRRQLDQVDVQNSSPYYYDVQGEDSNGDPTVILWPIPDGVYTLNYYCVVRQPDISSKSASAGSTIITVPWEPIYLGAYALAIEERGEENGTQLTRAQDAYKVSLADHVALDMQKTEYEDTWTVK